VIRPVAPGRSNPIAIFQTSWRFPRGCFNRSGPELRAIRSAFDGYAGDDPSEAGIETGERIPVLRFLHI